MLVRTLLLTLLAVTLAACEARQLGSASSGSSVDTACIRCHGSAENPAPPGDIRGNTATTAVGVGAHQAHVTAAHGISAPLDCVFCHRKPAAVNDPGHLDGRVTVTGYTGPDATWAAKVKDPGWSESSQSCTTSYCHGRFEGGNAGNAPVWTKVGTGQAACGTCHGSPPPAPHPVVSSAPSSCNPCHPQTVDAGGNIIAAAAGGKHLNGRIEGGHQTSWMDQASPDFHAYSANRGIATCQVCHGQNLDGIGGSTTVSCAQCHGGSWKTSCTMCHGGTDNGTGAPPEPTWGNADPIAVGAHTSHVAATHGLSAPLDCDACHVKPADALAAGHVDGSVAVSGYTGANRNLQTAIKDPGWNRATATCGTSYCHGAFPGGNANNAPVWTRVGQGQAACGTCHGLPPSAPHPAISGPTSNCNPCHPQTVDVSGNVIAAGAGGKHLDGVVQAIQGHDDSWKDQASAGFHAYTANRGLGACQFCHGQNLDGVGGTTTIACAQCHGASWKTSCTMCHGGTDSLTGAPPRATWGNTDPAAIGAHTSHVAATHGLSAPLDCVACHVKPADALAAGHIDATVGVTGYTGTDPGLLAAVKNPGWSVAGASCGTSYCHGAFRGGNAGNVPVWTRVGQGQAACGTCHDLPPPAPHPVVSSTPSSCHDCHSQTVDLSGNLIAVGAGGKHLNGLVEGGHLASWMDKASLDFHAYSANRGIDACQVCHGQNLDGIGGSTTVSCADCHGASWKTSCTMCHGGTDNLTGAPPKATWGNQGDPVRIGAHTSHVATNPVSSAFSCAECHATPADALSPGHIDGPVTVRFAGPVSGQAVGGVWNGPASPTCSSTYCHGNFKNGCVTYPNPPNACTPPDWTGANQAACGSCHPARPIGFLHIRHQSASVPGTSTPVTCDQCHSGIATSTGATGATSLVVTGGAGPALHVNGTTDVLFRLGGTYTKAPGQGTCSNTSCHLPQPPDDDGVRYWPR